MEPVTTGPGVGTAEPACLGEVLLIEDDAEDADLLRRAVSRGRIPVRVTHVDNGDAALDLLRARAASPTGSLPDLVLLDLNLPGLSGHEVLGTVRADAALRTVPVIVLSTSRVEEDVRRAYEAAANAYVHKRELLSDLVEVLRSLDRFWLRSAELPGVRTGGPCAEPVPSSRGPAVARTPCPPPA